MVATIAGYAVGYINGVVAGQKKHKEQVRVILTDLRKDSDRTLKQFHYQTLEWAYAVGDCAGVRSAIAAVQQEHWFLGQSERRQINNNIPKGHYSPRLTVDYNFLSITP